MSAQRIIRRTLEDPSEGRTDWARFDALTEEEIEANALADSENPPWTEEQLRNARLVMPEERAKVSISMRVDPEVLEYFKSQGPGYQTRMNAVLRTYVRTAGGKPGADRSRP